MELALYVNIKSITIWINGDKMFYINMNCFSTKQPVLP